MWTSASRSSEALQHVQFNTRAEPRSASARLAARNQLTRPRPNAPVSGYGAPHTLVTYLDRSGPPRRCCSATRCAVDPDGRIAIPLVPWRARRGAVSTYVRLRARRRHPDQRPAIRVSLQYSTGIDLHADRVGAITRLPPDGDRDQDRDLRFGVNQLSPVDHRDRPVLLIRAGALLRLTCARWQVNGSQVSAATADSKQTRLKVAVTRLSRTGGDQFARRHMARSRREATMIPVATGDALPLSRRGQPCHLVRGVRGAGAPIAAVTTTLNGAADTTILSRAWPVRRWHPCSATTSPAARERQRPLPLRERVPGCAVGGCGGQSGRAATGVAYTKASAYYDRRQYLHGHVRRHRQPDRAADGCSTSRSSPTTSRRSTWIRHGRRADQPGDAGQRRRVPEHAN